MGTIGKILLIAVVILLLWYFIDKDSLIQKGDAIFSKLREKAQEASQNAFQGVEQNMAQNAAQNNIGQELNYGKIPCNINSDCIVFSQTAICLTDGNCAEATL